MSRQKEFNEDEVLEKAMLLFWEKGYYATSAQNIVDKLGISRSSIYDTFFDKKNLFKRALQKYVRDQSKGLFDMLEQTDNLKETIRNVFIFTAQSAIEEKSSKGCFMINTAIELSFSDSEIKAMVESNFTDVENAFATSIRKAQQAGKFPIEKDPLALGSFLANSLAGLKVSVKVISDSKYYNGIIETVMKFLD